MDVSIKTLDTNGLSDLLLSKGLPQDVQDSFFQHGETLLEMNEDHLKEVAPRIGDRITLSKLIAGERVC